MPLTAASVCLLVLTAFWISSAPGTIPNDVRYTTRYELQRITRQGGFGSERVNPMAAAMALLHPQASEADRYAWADAPGQGRPLRPYLPTPWYAAVRICASALFAYMLCHRSNKVDPQQPLPEYPRPQMVRKHWLNLNGVWDFEAIGYAVTPTPMVSTPLNIQATRVPKRNIRQGPPHTWQENSRPLPCRELPVW